MAEGVRKRIFDFAVNLSRKSSQLEKVVWIASLILFAASWGVQYWVNRNPGFESSADFASRAITVFNDGASYFQAASITLIILLPVMRFALSKNPVEALAVRGIRKRFPALIRDLEAIVLNNVIRFDNTAVDFVDSDEELSEFSELNTIAFSSSAVYYAPAEEKAQRNAAIHEKYEKSFAIVRDVKGLKIGFSMVIPLNEDASDLYLSGRLSDHDIKKIHVASAGEKAGIILLFAIGLKPEFEAERGGERKSIYIRQLLRCHALHISSVAKDFDEKTVPFIAQIEKPSIQRLVKVFGFRRLPSKGLDGDPLYAITWSELAETLRQQTPTTVDR